MQQKYQGAPLSPPSRGPRPRVEASSHGRRGSFRKAEGTPEAISFRQQQQAVCVEAPVWGAPRGPPGTADREGGPRHPLLTRLSPRRARRQQGESDGPDSHATETTAAAAAATPTALSVSPACFRQRASSEAAQQQREQLTQQQQQPQQEQQRAWQQHAQQHRQRQQQQQQQQAELGS
ncbi:hypothetical protein Emag_003001 [Eimeria magna]